MSSSNPTDMVLAFVVERYVALLTAPERHRVRRSVRAAKIVEAHALQAKIVEISTITDASGVPAASRAALMAAITALGADEATRAAARPLVQCYAPAGTVNVLCCGSLFSDALQRWAVSFDDVAALIDRLDDPAVASMHVLVERTEPSTRWQLAGRIHIADALSADEDNTYRKARLACTLTDTLIASPGARAVFDVLTQDAGQVAKRSDLLALVDAACDVTSLTAAAAAVSVTPHAPAPDRAFASH